ncbi:UDP-N-acetyl-D-mannosaminuronic acid dehydrogenase [Glutamicibacter mysorens]|uniref:UDP-N-acetyl-D-mannosaminuronic acid dehydrogenase n=1 Tax=Glutamicibacter mysorens TaxID=257984 RepID=A0ABX4MWC7_9MICC|nr:UDP-N-acetyl-D-mannosamine dehydrogenase [Glutamicibacter mysorens]PJJ43618.1 UDP-N-acetyl-D-mannosaminuronic acid dehydrogenase [Glutamicibacter mysorens]
MTGIKEVSVIGLGYIGLPTAAILAANGIRVHGVDVNERNVVAVNNGEVPFVEPELGDFVARGVQAGMLSASLENKAADAYILAVPTPFNDDYSADLSYIEAAADGIAPLLTGDELVILESTSPPGTTEHLTRHLAAARPDLDMDQLLVAHCPERVLPGYVMKELVTNDRIVGGMTPRAAELAKKLYETFCKAEILTTDAITAEMSKLVENSYRDVNIAFANELSTISDKLGINVWELIELANHHPRVNILQPGPGVGGHCIAVDPWFIVAAAPDEAQLIRQARVTNDAKPHWVITKTELLMSKADNPVVALLGLAFKKNIDDLRESPALQIALALAKKNPSTRFVISEPNVEVLPTTFAAMENVELADPADAIEQAGTVVLLVDHDEYADIQPGQLEGKQVIDTRGQWRFCDQGTIEEHEVMENIHA